MGNMNNKLLLFLMFTIFTFLSFTQKVAIDAEEYVVQFFKTLQTAPQEKLYLHIDKPYYAAGDSIWFKGYLVNATTHTGNLPGNFIYVELIDRKDSIVYRKKIKRTNDIFQGNIPLSANFAAGDYLIRSYSTWMRNIGDDFFYTRKIKIANSIDISIRSAIEYIQSENGDTNIKIHFTDTEDKPFERTKIKCTLCYNSKKIKDKTITSDSEGNIYMPYDKNNITAGSYIKTEFLNSDYIYEKTFFLPDSTQKFDLAFLPEGGNFLANTSQQVAFKCQQSDGHGKNISGVILTQQGDTVTPFKTEHDGMGVFAIYPNKDEQYIAKIDSSEQKFNLPLPLAKGFALSIIQVKETLRYQIKSTPETTWPDTLFLVAHTRGYPILLTVVSEENSSGSINLNNISEGITHFLLIDKNGIPISQRLTFIYPDSQPVWNVSCNQKNYAKREKVSMQISLNTPDGTPLSGDFSIAVTDNKTVKPDTMANNILSDLLLTSDLKGYIGNPGYYFTRKDRKVLRNLDLLMLTHGWSRFNISNFKQTPEINPQFFIEKGQFISGKINNFIGKAAKEANVTAFETKSLTVKEIKTNEKGEFYVDGIDYVDSTTIIIQARTKRGFAMVTIQPDEETIPEKKIKIPFRSDSLSQINDDYLFKTREKYYYEGGIRVYNLKEVIVKGKRSEDRKAEAESVWSDYSMTSEMLSKSVLRTAEDLLRHSYPNRPEEAPLVVVDDMPCWEDDFILSTIAVEDIKSFVLYKDQTKCRFGSPGKKGPAIIITLKPEAMNRRTQGIAWLKTLGYTQMAEFYNPAYDTPEKKADNKPDLRTTIYWNPALKLDSVGKTSIEFYTSDFPSSYNVEIEGITKEGKACRYMQPLQQ